MTMQSLGLGIVALLLIIAAISDARYYRIPNWLNAVIALTFVVSQLSQSASGTEWIVHFGAAALMLLAGFILFSLNLFGGGDVKLIAALALWTGFTALPRFILLTTLAGGVLALLLLILRWLRAGRGNKIDSRVPYGIAIALAGLDFCMQQQGIDLQLLNLMHL
ncbi:MAG TPA: prepilin peptidase [Terriglobales bacterium]|nr:prepilin peptidase [Terriglobales bacterium]